MYKLDHKNQRIITNDYLTVMNLVVQRELCKISFGIPSDLIIFEDIMLNCELDALRETFLKVFDRVNKKQDLRFAN